MLVVIVAATILLVVFRYYGRPESFWRMGLDDVFAGWLPAALDSHRGLLGYLWWGAASLVLRVAVPLGIIVWVLRERPGRYGFRISGVGRHWAVYLGAFVVMVPVLVWASTLDSFQSYYPFYSGAAEGGAAFWVYEAGYALQFVGVESFFRGFLVFGLEPRFGSAGAVAVMTVPYTMIHFGKPMPEAFAAIVAGFALGYFALRTRSFVPGIALHVAVALAMDLLVLHRTVGLPALL